MRTIKYQDKWRIRVMKTTMFTPLLVIVMVASLVIALPVVSVQAASPHVTYFTGTATVVGTPGTVTTVGRCELMTGSVITATYTCDDPRFTGTITNILTSLTKPNGKSTMWSTSSSFVRADGLGTIAGRLWGQGIMPTVLTGHYIGYGDGFKVLMKFNGNYGEVAVSGKIIET
jgi:hypothetical protein